MLNVYIYTILRATTFIPLTAIILVMVDNIYHRRNMNGLTPTRYGLLALFIAIWFNLLAYLIAGFHAILFGSMSYHQMLAKLSWLLIISRVITLYAVIKFYLLIRRNGGQHG